MKIQKALAVTAALVFLFAGGAYALSQTPFDPHAGLQGVPQEETATEGGAVFHTGFMEGINSENREIIVRMTVPGILGETEATVPLRIGDDTTVTVCLLSINECSTADSGAGWELIERFESFGVSGAQKRVFIVGEEDSGRVVHVHIDYVV